MENYLLYLGRCGLQPNSIFTKMNGLSIFYKYLIGKGITMFNPIYYIPKPHKLKTEDHRHFLTEEHIEIDEHEKFVFMFFCQILIFTNL